MVSASGAVGSDVSSGHGDIIAEINKNSGHGRARKLPLSTFTGSPNLQQTVVQADTTSIELEAITRSCSNKRATQQKTTGPSTDRNEDKPAPVRNRRTGLEQQHGERNSIESLHSRFSASTSSFVGSNTSLASLGAGAQATQNSSPPGRPASAIIQTRYVSPPSLSQSWSASLESCSANTSPHNRNNGLEESICKLDFEEQPKPNGDLHRDSSDKAANDQTNVSKNARKTLDANSNDKSNYRENLKSLPSNQIDSGGSATCKKCLFKSNPKSQPPSDPYDSRSRASNGSSQPSPTPASRSNTKKGPFLFAGILASLIASLSFSSSILFVQLMPDIDSFAEKTKALCSRGIIITLLSAASILYNKSTFKVPRDELLVNALRAIFGFAGVYGSYMAIQYISIGDSTALVFSSPIWTCILSHFILKEPLRVIHFVALPICLFGVVLIAHPALIIDMDAIAGPLEREPLLQLEDLDNSTGGLLATDQASYSANTTSGLATHHKLLNADLDAATNYHEALDIEHRWPGIAIALATSLAVSCVYIVLKFRKTTPIQTTTFWLGAVTVVGSVFLMFFIGFGTLPTDAYGWLLLFGNGFCSWLGQCLLQWALMHEEASILSVLRTADVAITYVLSAMFLEEDIFWTSVVGATIIVLVVISIVLHNWVLALFCPTSTSSRSQPVEESRCAHCGCPSESVDLNADRDSCDVTIISSSDEIYKLEAQTDRLEKMKRRSTSEAA